MTAERGEWCIVRTSGGKTLPLAAAFVAAGIDAWTPRQVEQRLKAPRRRTADPAKQPRDVPILPSFVFVHARHLAEIIVRRADPLSPLPRYSVFQYAGRIPLVRNRDIADLRALEAAAEQKLRKGRKRKLVMGQRVRFDQGAFAGLNGVIESQKGQFAVVAFGDFRVDIASWLLPEDVVHNHASPLGAAA